MKSRAIYKTFLQMLVEFRKDFMLLIMVFVPFIIGIVFKFLIPVIENLITEFFNVSEIITPYYQLIDIFLILMTPMMFNYVLAIVMLEEHDNGITNYLFITPLRKGGYIFSRLGIATLISIPFSLIIYLLFHHTEFTLLNVLLISILAALQGFVIALMIVSLSSNKVEGMAMGKMSALLVTGVTVPYFIDGSAQYFFVISPSYWLAKALVFSEYIFLIISFGVIILWSGVLIRKFKKKVL